MLKYGFLLFTILFSFMCSYGECSRVLPSPTDIQHGTQKSMVLDYADATKAGNEFIYPFFDNAAYKIHLRPGYITDIRLAHDEALNYVGGGDSYRWKIDTASNNTRQGLYTHIFIKPLMDGISTNLVIVTDKRTYHLNLTSDGVLSSIVSWRYDSKSSNIYFSPSPLSKTHALMPLGISFNYKISNTNLPWAPSFVFSSSSKTYIKMNDTISTADLPTLYVLDGSNKPVLVSYRYQSGYFIVDSVNDKYMLILGSDRVTIKRMA